MNFEAGAETPAAGVFAAVGIALAALFLTPLLFHLPHATLAATIVIAVLSLVEIGAFRRAYAYSPADAAAMAATIGVTLGWGVEPGLLAGVGLSIALHLFRISRPHVALVGQVPGTQHFRNVDRHTVVTDAAIASIRVDESLCFPNARFLEDRINELVAASPTVRHVVLVCSAVNEIDASALESLETVNNRLRDGGITFHLSEVKGPVMDRLKRSHFPRDLTGQIHLSQYDAICAIDADLARSTLEERRVAALDDQSIAATRDASLRERDQPRTKEDMMPVTVAELMAAARSAVPDISHEEARKLIDAGHALPVDVRDAAEVESSGRIKGALHVSRGHLEFKADPGSPVHEAALDRELTILVYCNSGGRAALAAKTLKDMGFRDVRNLGGFRDWVAAGGAVER